MRARKAKQGALLPVFKTAVFQFAGEHFTALPQQSSGNVKPTVHYAMLSSLPFEKDHHRLIINASMLIIVSIIIGIVVEVVPVVQHEEE